MIKIDFLQLVNRAAAALRQGQVNDASRVLKTAFKCHGEHRQGKRVAEVLNLLSSNSVSRAAAVTYDLQLDLLVEYTSRSSEEEERLILRIEEQNRKIDRIILKIDSHLRRSI